MDQHIKNPEPITPADFASLLVMIDRPLLVMKDRGKVARVLMAISHHGLGITVKYSKECFILLLPMQPEHYAAFVRNGLDKHYIEGHFHAWNQNWGELKRIIDALCIAFDIKQEA